MTKKASKSIEGTIVRIEFANGKSVSLNLTEVPDEVKTRLALHGASQKIGDSYAGAKDIDEAYENASKVALQLIAGEWSQTREGSSSPRTSLLAEALALLAQAGGKDVSVDDAAEAIEAMDDDTKKAVRANPQVKAKIAEIKLVRAQAAASAAQGNAEGSEVDVASLFA